ncbi:S8 family peptidase [Planctomyces sp. SH-PL14]|uniref:S8 family peptidase n=1 Tax=Planctomyces sp. SH-PL14 TaxID=1632864 RepID=UPI000946612E|nr:S8 family peptidase [Planctomyces sp. SH-PL14]
MNEGFPPLSFQPSETRPRRKEVGRPIPLPPELLARRQEIARVLQVQVSELSRRLKKMSEKERRAVFYKLQNDVGVNPKTLLVGTDLQVIAQPSSEVVYAVPKSDNLDKVAKKIQEFGAAPLVKGHAKNEWLGRLTSIEEGDPKDRLSDDLRQDYAVLIKKPQVICEIEFLSLVAGDVKRREEIEDWITDLQKEFSLGVHGNFFEHEIAPPVCRAVIRCTGAFFKRLVEEPKWIARIRWIESKPRFQTFSEITESFRVQDLAELKAPPKSAPIVCVIDSGVTPGNPFLKPVVHTGLTKSFLKHQPTNPNDENGHGSAVASLVAYHGLNLATGAENTPKLWVASARILDANNQIEDERLFSSVLEEVVKTFAPKGIKIYCLAVGDDSKIWHDGTRRSLPRKSWVARRIDQLSRKYDVVFVTCTGNVSLRALSDLMKAGTGYPACFTSDEGHLLDPGHAALALTVGSVAAGTKIASARDGQALALRNQPSPFTRCGPGIRGEIKPEIVEYGGNLAVDPASKQVRENKALQVVTASKQLTPAIAYHTGTSFAAPRAAHRLALVDQDLRSLGVKPTASLLRAFLVNSTMSWANSRELNTVRDGLAKAKAPEKLEMLLGYGLADHNRATACDDYSVVSFFQGEIAGDEVMFFDITVPAALAKSSSPRRLTVTVAHAPEVQRWGLERYCGTDIKWRMFRGDKSRDEIVAAMSESVSVSDEDLEPEEDKEGEEDDRTLPKELKFYPNLTKRSRGTVQHASHEWTHHKREYSDGNYTLAIACYKRWTRNVQKVPIAVVVRLEELGRTIPIYIHVRNAIEVEV